LETLLKSKLVIFVEGMLYMIIAAGPTWAVLLDSDKPLTERAVMATFIASLVAAATALKAFLSQAISNQKPDEKPSPDPDSPAIPQKRDRLD
jgi:hypothetical protein